MSETGQEKPAFHLGGQALIEGVMMRSPRFISASVRRADGSIETRVEPFGSVLGRSKVLRLPILRGFVALVEMMLVGTRYLRWSADVALASESEKTRLEQERASTRADSEGESRDN